MPQFPLIVAHRGASRHATENSVAAAEIAIQQGADMIEIDIRRTADDVLVAHHDPEVGHVPLRTLSYNAARQLLPEIATLSELLARVAGRAMLNLELKEEGYEDRVLDAVTGHVPCRQLLVSSFSSRVVQRVKRLDPSVRTGWIVSASQRDGLVSQFERTDADWLVAEHACLDSDLVSGLAARGIPLAVWTVNGRQEMDAAFRVPALRALITDLPDVARALRNGIRQESQHL